MKTKPLSASDPPKDAFLEKVAGLWPVAKGSLTLTRSPCTRKGCKACASGVKHPKWLFTFREGGRLRGLYVRPTHAARLRRAVENGRALERLMVEKGRDFVLALRQEAQE
jgi:hypothetical protein